MVLKIQCITLMVSFVEKERSGLGRGHRESPGVVVLLFTSVVVKLVCLLSIIHYLCTSLIKIYINKKGYKRGMKKFR